jgi:hypothetical protein
MLTDIQSRKLLLRDKEDPAERAKYDYIISKKLKKALDDLEGIDTVLTHLPKNKVQKVLTDKQVLTLLKAANLMMLKMDYRKVRSIDDEHLNVFQRNEDEQIKVVSPTKKDLQRAKMLYDHLHELVRFVDPTLLDRVQIPDYEKDTHWPAGIEDAYEFQLKRRQSEEPPK